MPDPNYFDHVAPPPEPNYFGDAGKANWKKHEKDIAKRAGERQVRGSGNQPGRPGDTMGNKHLREGKATARCNEDGAKETPPNPNGASITIREGWLRKIILEALHMGRTPVIEIRLERAEPPVPTDWVLLPSDDYQEMQNGSV